MADVDMQVDGSLTCQARPIAVVQLARWRRGLFGVFRLAEATFLVRGGLLSLLQNE
jgi:hypothetical protein